jgi:Fe-S-cluster containining protein
MDLPGLRQHLDAAGRDAEVLDALRERIPTFRCVVGCHDCCGPVTASSLEVARLPVKTPAEHAAALESLDCVYLGAHGCEVYGERPLICRLFGTTPNLPCPNGKRPLYLIDRRTEEEVQRVMAGTRQVLL